MFFIQTDSLRKLLETVGTASLVCLFSVSAFAQQNAKTVTVKSPSGKVEIELNLMDRDGQSAVPTFSVKFQGEPVLQDSRLGLEFEGSGALASQLSVADVKRQGRDETYEVIAGKSKTARDWYEEALVTLKENVAPHRQVIVNLRAYDDGAAVRYLLPEQEAMQDFVITDELTDFRFVGNPAAVALPLANYTTSYENFYLHPPLNELPQKQLFALPMLLHCGEECWAGLTEADLTDYAGLYVERVGEDSSTLVSRLSPLPDNSGGKVRGTLPHRSPWRVVMLGNDPGRLIESNLIVNLNEPCAIEDTSWIHPGKINFPWWNGYVVQGKDIEGGLNTATLKDSIDFCAEYGIEYSSLDGYEDLSWYGGPIAPTGPVDVTTAIPEIDLDEVLAYAESKGVRMRIWLHWKALVPQLDEALATYEKWGIEGIMVDFVDRDDQEAVKLYHELARKCAEHHLTLNIHGAYKPTGIRRTWPNFLTREGVKNLEYDKFGGDSHIPPNHTLTVPFTRMLAGPLDYHQGGFLNVQQKDFVSRMRAPMVIGTRAHSLANYVVLENPLPMVADHPGAYRGEPGAELFQRIPTTWDETRMLQGEVGEFIAMARRKGDLWCVGVMTNEEARTLELSLDFLGDGNFTADIAGDDDPNNYQSLRQESRTVEASETLKVEMLPAGGALIFLTPASR